MEAKYIDMELRIGDRDPYSLFKNKLYFILFYLITLEGSSGHDSSRFLINYNWVHTSFCFFLFHQHVRYKMILKIERYLSAYN